jgi:hypothetical protein
MLREAVAEIGVRQRIRPIWPRHDAEVLLSSASKGSSETEFGQTAGARGAHVRHVNLSFWFCLAGTGGSKVRASSRQLRPCSIRSLHSVVPSRMPGFCIRADESHFLDHGFERVGKFGVPKSRRTRASFAAQNGWHPPAPVFNQQITEQACRCAPGSAEQQLKTFHSAAAKNEIERPPAYQLRPVKTGGDELAFVARLFETL